MKNLILLIHPPSINTSGKNSSLGGSEHLGLGYLHSALNDKNKNVQVLNFEENFMDCDEASNYVLSLNPWLIGLSPTSYSVEWTSAFCAKIKENADIPIIVGGHLVSLLGENIFDIIQSIDFICVGDGEKVICEIVDELSGAKDYNSIQDIIYKDKQGKLIKTSNRSLGTLDEITWPVHQIGPNQTARISTSRGCHFNCDFCTTPSMYNNVRYRSIDDVVKEMVFLKNIHGVTRFFFSDDCFVDGTNIPRIMQFIHAVKNQLPNIEFRCEIRADFVSKHEDIIRTLYQVGMKYVFIGYESCIEKDLKLYNKKIDIKTIHNVPKILRKIGVSVVPGFIIFNESTTTEDMENNLKFLFENNYLYRTTSFVRTCMGYPGSSMYTKMLATGKYDKERSKEYLLFPQFDVSYIRTISIALQEVEMMYLEIDMNLLNMVIYNYEEKFIRTKTLNGQNLIDADLLFSKIQNFYFNKFSSVISLARTKKEELTFANITDIFKNGLLEIQALSKEFARVLT